MAKTLRERYCAGLEALGFERDTRSRSTKFIAYRRPDDSGKRWYVGASGSLRVGAARSASHPVGLATKEHVLSAPARRAAVFARLGDRGAVLPDADAVRLTESLREMDPAIREMPMRSVLSHVNAWLKEPNG